MNDQIHDDSNGKPGIVFIVDDEENVRVSLQRFLTSHGYETTAFASAIEFLEQPPHDGVGCLILDLQMPNMSGVELQKRLVDSGSSLPIVFLTAQGDIPTGVKAMKLGAEDFLPKMSDTDELLEAVERALARSKSKVKLNEDLKHVRQAAARLTARERNICECVITGMLNKQIASRMELSERTVKAHRAKVMQKFDVHSVADLVRLSEKAGISPVE